MNDNKKPTDYLLNYVDLVPGTLEAVYETVAKQPGVTLAQCRNLLFYRKDGDSQTDHVLLALNFLEATDVVARTGEVYQAPFGPLPPYGIRTKVINGLKAQTERQAHFMRIHELLVKDGRVSIEVGPLMGFLDQNGIVTDRASINDVKLGFWMRFMDFLGLLHQPTRDKSVSLTPYGELLFYLLKEAAAGAEEISLPRFLVGLEQDYFSVTTRKGELHPGVGAALVGLRERGRIGLAIKSDAPAVKLAETVTASHITLKEGESDV